MSTFYNVWYMKPEHFRDGIMGALPKPDLTSHVKLHVIEFDEDPGPVKKVLETLFSSHQGEVWSPQGEARPLLESLGLQHTSMSVGDVIEKDDGRFWVVAARGFKEITDHVQKQKIQKDDQAA